MQIKPEINKTPPHKDITLQNGANGNVTPKKSPIFTGKLKTDIFSTFLKSLSTQIVMSVGQMIFKLCHNK